MKKIKIKLKESKFFYEKSIIAIRAHLSDVKSDCIQIFNNNLLSMKNDTALINKTLKKFLNHNEKIKFERETEKETMRGTDVIETNEEKES